MLKKCSLCSGESEVSTSSLIFVGNLKAFLSSPSLNSFSGYVLCSSCFQKYVEQFNILTNEVKKNG